MHNTETMLVCPATEVNDRSNNSQNPWRGWNVEGYTFIRKILVNVKEILLCYRLTNRKVECLYKWPEGGIVEDLVLRRLKRISIKASNNEYNPYMLGRHIGQVCGINILPSIILGKWSAHPVWERSQIQIGWTNFWKVRV